MAQEEDAKSPKDTVVHPGVWLLWLLMLLFLAIEDCDEQAHHVPEPPEEPSGETDDGEMLAEERRYVLSAPPVVMTCVGAAAV